MASKSLKVEILGDSKSLQRALGQATTTSSKFGHVLGTVVKAGAVAAGAALAGLGVAAKVGFDEFTEHQKVYAQVAARIKSTGAAANVTAKHIDELANAQLQLTGIDDEAIASADAMLLSFRKVRNEAGKGNDIFDQATVAIENVATAYNEGAVPSSEQLQKVTIQLGKALQDPIKGMTGLRRVGITFTQAQQDAITAMVESGHQMEAQKFILRELQKEFGGAAAAAGQTLPAQLSILKENFKDLASAGIAPLIPLVTRFTQWAIRELPTIRTIFGAVFHAIGSIVGTVVGFIEDHLTVSSQTFDHYGNVVKHTSFRFQAALNRIKEIAQVVFDAVRSFIVQHVVPAFSQLKDHVQLTVQKIVAVFEKHREDLIRIWNNLKSAVQDVWDIFTNDLLPLLRHVLPKAIDGAIPILAKLTDAIALVASWAETATNWVRALIEALGNLPNPGGGGLLERLGIKFPKESLLGKLQGQQHGGPVAAGRAYIVGERRPELFVPNSSGRILPHVPSGGATMVFNFPNYVGDKRELEAAMRDVVMRYARQNGGRLAF